MIVRAFDGDIATSGTQFKTGKAAIAQTIRTRLSLWLGEYFRNINDGTPWIQEILGKQFSEQTRESAIKRRIEGTVGVQEITQFDADFDLTTRAYIVTCSVITNDGDSIDVTTEGAI